MSDQELFEGLCRKDEAVIEQIYQRFAEKIKSYILRNSGNAADAKDVFHNGLMTIYVQYCQDYDRFRSFEGLLFTICKNQWLDQLKKKNRENDIRKLENDRYSNEEETQNLPELAEQAVDRMKKDRCLDKTFKQLSELCQKLLYLKFVEEASGSDIADELNMTNPNTVYQRAFDCRRRWRQLYDEQCKN